ncbi:DNA ligase (ATP) (plasmid) [Rhizobium leguminosarum bv. trifolii]
MNGPRNDHAGAVRLSETLDGEPNVLLEHVCRLGLEGIVGKHLDRHYRSGRTGDWVKVKCVQSEAFFIVGYERSAASPAGFGSLVLAAYRGDELVHVGSVGTGFRQAEATRLRKVLDTLRWKRKPPPLRYSGSADIAWVQPTLIAEIEFRAWTSDGKLRHPSYKGLRERQDNADVFLLD